MELPILTIPVVAIFMLLGLGFMVLLMFLILMGLYRISRTKRGV